MIVFYIFLITGCAILGLHEHGKVYDKISHRIDRRRMNGMPRNE